MATLSLSAVAEVNETFAGSNASYLTGADLYSLFTRDSKLSNLS